MKAETTYSAVIGRVIAVWRKKSKISQEDAAEKADINRFSWSRIERGDMAANVYHLSHIAKALGRAMDEIIKEADEKKTLLEKIGIAVHMRPIRYENNRPVSPHPHDIATSHTPAHCKAHEDEFFSEMHNIEQHPQDSHDESARPVALLDVAALEGLMYDVHLSEVNESDEDQPF